MQVIDAKFYDSQPGQFSISVFGQHAYRFWKENLYLFKYENGKVYFPSVVGKKEDDKLVGEAQNKEEAIEKATTYLEGWLKQCGEIGELDRDYRHLMVNREDHRGPDYFTVQVCVRDKDEKENPRRDTLFTFVFESGQVYFLGDDKQETRDLVKFVYRPWQRTLKPAPEQELNVFPKDKEEAIRDAIDYLEWWLSEQGRL